MIEEWIVDLVPCYTAAEAWLAQWPSWWEYSCSCASVRASSNEFDEVANQVVAGKPGYTNLQTLGVGPEFLSLNPTSCYQKPFRFSIHHPKPGGPCCLMLELCSSLLTGLCFHSSWTPHSCLFTALLIRRTQVCCLPHAGIWVVAQPGLCHQDPQSACFVLQALSAHTLALHGVQLWLLGPVLAQVVSASPWMQTGQETPGKWLRCHLFPKLFWWSQPLALHKSHVLPHELLVGLLLCTHLPHRWTVCPSEDTHLMFLFC